MPRIQWPPCQDHLYIHSSTVSLASTFRTPRFPDDIVDDLQVPSSSPSREADVPPKTVSPIVHRNIFIGQCPLPSPDSGNRPLRHQSSLGMAKYLVQDTPAELLRGEMVLFPCGAFMCGSPVGSTATLFKMSAARSTKHVMILGTTRTFPLSHLSSTGSIARTCPSTVCVIGRPC